MFLDGKRVFEGKCCFEMFLFDNFFSNKKRYLFFDIFCSGLFCCSVTCVLDNVFCSIFVSKFVCSKNIMFERICFYAVNELGYPDVPQVSDCCKTTQKRANRRRCGLTLKT